MSCWSQIERSCHLLLPIWGHLSLTTTTEEDASMETDMLGKDLSSYFFGNPFLITLTYMIIYLHIIFIYTTYSGVLLYYSVLFPWYRQGLPLNLELTSFSDRLAWFISLWNFPNNFLPPHSGGVAFPATTSFFTRVLGVLNCFHSCTEMLYWLSVFFSQNLYC